MSGIVERVRQAVADRKPLRLRGAGTWMSAGRPVEAGTVLSLADHRGIIEYVPGDLTLTARAGTPLSEIASATSAHDQWLPLDPWGGDAGSIGATVSTATAGPHSYAMGLPRDVVLGLECVTGTGAVMRPGGRVVKNVAGFDLTRLVVGAWGTLGVITEVTVRLRARPAVTKTLSYRPKTGASDLNDLALKLRALPFTPMVSELVNESFAQDLGFAAETRMLLRIGGNARSVAAQVDVLRSLGDLEEGEDSVWARLRTEPANASSWRWSSLPSEFGITWSVARAARSDGEVRLHGNPARGAVRVVATADVTTPRMPPRDYKGTLIVESLPAKEWSQLDVPPFASDTLSRAIREKFDPAGLFNAGILGVET